MIEQPDEGLVARVLRDGVEEREDLALMEDPFSESIVGPRRTDGGADIEPSSASA